MVYRPDDEEDPTTNDCNYNFGELVFAFLLGFVCMFVLSVKEIHDFKGCTYESRNYRTRTNGRGDVSSSDQARPRSMGIQEQL